MARRKRFWNLAWIAGLAVVFFIFLWGIFLMQARRAFLSGEMAAQQGAEPLARQYYEQAIRARAPFNLYAKRAAARLEAIARRFEQRGETIAAIDAYEGLAAALSATSAGWSRSNRDRIAGLEEKIRVLRQKQEGAGEPLRGGAP
jgi:hypothetical protein